MMLKSLILGTAAFLSAQSFAADFTSLFPLEIANCQESRLGTLKVFALAAFGEETPREGKALVMFQNGESTSLFTASYYGQEGGVFDIASPTSGVKISVRQGENYTTELEVASETVSVTCTGQW